MPTKTQSVSRPTQRARKPVESRSNENTIPTSLMSIPKTSMRASQATYVLYEGMAERTVMPSRWLEANDRCSIMALFSGSLRNRARNRARCLGHEARGKTFLLATPSL
jgi:hypothetical protein